MKIKNEKGSITIFVLIGLLFMASFLMISYGYNVNKSKIAKEQFNTISKIYMPNDNEIESYTQAYTYLRKKNKQVLTYNSATYGLSSVSEIELKKTYAEKVIDYKIYGSTHEWGVGDLITDPTDENNGKYEIRIKLTDEEDRSDIYSIYLSSPLKSTGILTDYIDYKERKVIRQVDTQAEEIIDLPEMDLYEDYNKIEILTEIPPSMIEIEYIGYKFE